MKLLMITMLLLCSLTCNTLTARPEIPLDADRIKVTSMTSEEQKVLDKHLALEQRKNELENNVQKSKKYACIAAGFTALSLLVGGSLDVAGYKEASNLFIVPLCVGTAGSCWQGMAYAWAKLNLYLFNKQKINEE